MASITDQLPEDAPTAFRRTLSWPAIAWFTALLVIAYFPVLKHLVEQWSTDDDVGHGFFVPVVAGYIAWQRREEILALDWKPAWWGLALIAWGGAQVWVGMLGA